MGSGPGLAGSGGPWIEVHQSMQHLVASSVEVQGPRRFRESLPVPAPRSLTRYSKLTPELIGKRDAFYRDVAVVAYPTPVGEVRMTDIDEKALYDRLPFSSVEGVKPYLPAPARYRVLDPDTVIDPDETVDLTDHLRPDGTFDWDVPPGT